MSNMISPELNKVCDKISKLFALAESSNENEAQAALLKAQELMMRNNLSMKDISIASKIQDEKENPIEQKYAKNTFKKATWKISLAMVIAENFKCYHMISKFNRTNHNIFMGRREDVVICNSAYEYAESIITKEVGKIKSKFISKGMATAGIENDYATGFVRGLKTKFAQQIKDHAEWGLVIVKDSGLVKHHDDMKMKKTSVNYNKVKDTRIYDRGYHEGMRFGVADRIAE